MRYDQRIQLEDWRHEFSQLVMEYGSQQLEYGLNLNAPQAERDAIEARCRTAFKTLLVRIQESRPMQLPRKRP